jgi:hypothetical protein
LTGKTEQLWPHSLSLLGFVQAALENGFNGHAKKSRNTEGELQAGIISSRFNGVDGLARHLQPLGKVCLGPSTLGSKDSKTVFHVGS